MPTSHRSHHYTLFFFQKSLRTLFWSAFLRESGLSLVSVFTFIYLFKTGVAQSFFPLSGISAIQQGLMTLVAYVLLLRVTLLIAIFPLAKLASRYGLPASAIIGNFLIALRFGLLALSVREPWLIFVAACIQGCEIAAFNPAYETMFARRASMAKVGRDVGAFLFILRLSHALLPAVAGVLIIGFGFSAAFIGTMFLLLLSNIPLLSMRWHEKLLFPKPQRLVAWWRKDGDVRVLIAVLGRYTSEVVLELWPIYLILLFGRIERVGLLMSLSLFLSLIITYFSGWYIDHTKKNFPFVIGGVLLSLFSIGRIGAVTLPIILALEIAQKVVESFFTPSFDTSVYRIAKKLDTFAFNIYKEFLLSCFSVILWLCLGALFIGLGPTWNWLFVLGAVGMLASTVIYVARYE